ncbi:MAG: hypothetical protein POH28_15105, partial [Acidocella sp.]|nr:hypothetical protein [Acidocella sp.]
VAIFFIVPMIAGGSVNACQALERSKVSNFASTVAGGNHGTVYNALNSVGQSVATGKVASAVVANEHPDSPAPLSCTYDYWTSML